jgi:NitT/TauT family transport system ATP-binding protein
MADKFSLKDSLNGLLKDVEKKAEGIVSEVQKFETKAAPSVVLTPAHLVEAQPVKPPIIMDNIPQAYVGNDRLKPVNFVNTHLPDIIELKNIKQVYPNQDGSETTVLNDLNLLIEDKPGVGQFVTIMGGSGCGKSTVLRYLTGLQKPTSGEVLYHGKPLCDGKRINMVFQQYSSMPWMTVIENVALGLKYQGVPKKERLEQAAEMLKIVGLAGHENKFAQYPQLSGGQLQRVAIARSLLANKEILLLDEPFGALDIKTRMDMQETLLQIWYEIHPTIIMVTHDINEAVHLSDDIYLMSARPGQIVEHLNVEIPYPRSKNVRRLSKFTEYAHYLEDRLTEIQSLR